MTVNYDTDGTPYMTVQFTVTVSVIADNEDAALYHADLMDNEAFVWSEGTVL